MKNESRYVLYLIFFITIFIIMIELYSIAVFHRELANGKIGLPKTCSTFELAEDDYKNYVMSQISASHSKFKSVSVDLLKHSIFISIALLFLNRRMQRVTLRLCEKRISMIKQGFRELNRVEINFMCLISLLYLTSVLVISYIKSQEIDYMKLVQYAFLFLALYLLVIPMLLFVLYMLLTKFHKKFIIACYFAYIVKVLPDILMDDQVDNQKMVKKDIGDFPEDVQDVLRKYEMQDKVYVERNPGDEMNAALIGYGTGMRMEIYGSIKTFPKDKLFSVFLHEIGHADEKSLLKKSIIYFSIIIFEMFLICWIYDKLSAKYTNDTISIFTSFVLLVFIYRVLIRQWPLSLHKLSSQHSEMASDLFAKKYDYGDPLAVTLFDIGISSKDYITPTLAYNALRSTHPSIYSRVEYLLGRK